MPGLDVRELGPVSRVRGDRAVRGDGVCIGDPSRCRPLLSLKLWLLGLAKGRAYSRDRAPRGVPGRGKGKGSCPG